MILANFSNTVYQALHLFKVLLHSVTKFRSVVLLLASLQKKKRLIETLQDLRNQAMTSIDGLANSSSRRLTAQAPKKCGLMKHQLVKPKFMLSVNVERNLDTYIRLDVVDEDSVKMWSSFLKQTTKQPTNQPNQRASNQPGKQASKQTNTHIIIASCP